jgi:hypothetical protein
MDGPVRLKMPDGTVIWARVEGAVPQVSDDGSPYPDPEAPGSPDDASEPPDPDASRSSDDVSMHPDPAAAPPGSGFAPPASGFAAPPAKAEPKTGEPAGVDVVWHLPGRGHQAEGGGPAGLAGFAETVKSVAASVHDAVVAQAPSAVSVEFGLELSVQTGQFVAVLAQAGVKTSVKVRLEWDRAALAGADATDPAAEAAKDPAAEAGK